MDFGSGNDYSKHLAFHFVKFENTIVSVRIDIILLIRFKMSGRVWDWDGAVGALFYPNSFSWEGDDLKCLWFIARNDVEGFDFFGGYPFEIGVKQYWVDSTVKMLTGSNCQGGAKD